MREFASFWFDGSEEFCWRKFRERERGGGGLFNERRFFSSLNSRCTRF